MAPTLPLLYLEPPEVEPYAHGLFGAALPVTMPDEHWLIGGVEWDSLAAYQSSLSRAGVLASYGSGGTKASQAFNTRLAAQPYNVFAGVQCASIGYDAAYWHDRVLRILELSGQHAAEKALWTGQGVANAALATPVSTTAGSTSGGTLAAATYGYRVSALNPQGETLASTETTVVTTGTTSSVTVSWTTIPGATAYNVYGRTSGGELLLATVGPAAVSYIDTGAGTPAGALPSSNTTATTAVSLNASTTATVSGSATSMTRAVGALEKWLGDNYAGRGFLHATRQCAANASATNQIRIANNDAETSPLLTPLGTRWIFGGGYDGTGPANAAPGTNQAWIYATGVVSLYRNTPDVPIDLPVGVNRLNNQVFLIGEQQYIATIDGPIGAALVDLTL